MAVSGHQEEPTVRSSAVSHGTGSRRTQNGSTIGMQLLASGSSPDDDHGGAISKAFFLWPGNATEGWSWLRLACAISAALDDQRQCTDPLRCVFAGWLGTAFWVLGFSFSEFSPQSPRAAVLVCKN